MLAVEEIDLSRQDQVRRFVDLTYHLHEGIPQWVPPLRADEKTYLDRRRHPFYGHSEASFFLAVEEGRDIGRLAVLNNRPYNQHHQSQTAQFYLFECENNQEATNALFEAGFQWAWQRGLRRMIGPKGFSVLDGFGLLVKGFDLPQVMSLLTYNPPYYADLVESNGFTKEIDFLSASLEAEDFHLPPWLTDLAASVEEKYSLRGRHFSMQEAATEWNSWSERLITLYNQTFIDSWEYWPLTLSDIRFVSNSIRPLVRPELMTVIEKGRELEGFLFAFPDVSAALRRAQGKLSFLTLADLLIERQRSRGVVLYALGLSPRLRLEGGVAVLISHLEKMARKNHIRHVDFTEIAESTWQVLNELQAFGIRTDRVHRVYHRDL
jgi:hypothetical protein